MSSLRTQDDIIHVEYEVISPIDISRNAEREVIKQSILDLDDRMAKNQALIDELNVDIDKLTNHADGFDYAIAVGTGILCGLIDSFFVGEFNFERGKAKSHKQVNQFIQKFAKLNGYKGDRLNGAIDFLEKKFPVAHSGDCNWNAGIYR